MDVKVSCLDANMTAGWQEMKNEQCVTIQATEKQIYGTFEMSMAPLETEDVRKKQLDCSSRILLFSELDRNSKHPGSVPSHFVHSHSCLQSFKCMDHLVQIITHSDLLSFPLKLFHLHSTPKSKALSLGLAIF